jgi:F420-dependent oxidoreductase-like protein
MRIGLNSGGIARGGFDETLARFSKAEADGFYNCWASSAGYDPIMLLSHAGRVTQTLELGTAIIPTYPRHPIALAQMALTAQAATNNRFVLGIGLSHRVSMEERLGFDFSKPILHMREYLMILKGALSGQAVDFQGKLYRVKTQLTITGVTPPPVIVAALGAQMLKLAGTLADGTITWMGGPKYLETTAIPHITKAAQAAGKPAPRVVAGFPICVTNKMEAAKATVAQTFANYANLPSYRAILEIEGAPDVTLAAIVGDESAVEKQLRQLAAIGVTDFNGQVVGLSDDPDAAKRTREFLATLAKAGI